MVLRKNAPQDCLVPAPLLQAANNPPYPVSPSDEHPDPFPPLDQPGVYSLNSHRPPSLNFEPPAERREQQDDGPESDYSDNEWDRSDDEFTPEELPGPLKKSGGEPTPVSADNHALPEALRAGPRPGVAIKKSLEAIFPELTGPISSSPGAVSHGSGESVPLQTNNPYLKMQNTGLGNFAVESSQSVWEDSQLHLETYGQLAELPTQQTPDTPSHSLANLTLGETAPHTQRSHSIDQPPLIAVDPASPQSAHPRWGFNVLEKFPPALDISSLDTFSRTNELPKDVNNPISTHQSRQEQQAWEKSERGGKRQEVKVAHETAIKADQERRHEEESHCMEQSSHFAPLASPPTSSPFQEQAFALPPQWSHAKHAPPTPPRPFQSGIVGDLNSEPETSNIAMNRQRKEHYQIKHVRWYDINKRGVRTSPILTQNLNGPCPLLALVNALVLSTPAGIETALVETLRTREQITLGLLLDAVFDELMSGRRGGAAQELPDVAELYQFLLLLHTGLNVNPVFVQDPDATSGTSAPTSSLAGKPGGFESTREMRLYGTFDIPLVHGWLPDPGSEAYRSLERIAKSYELSQYVQFQEEELDAKLQSGEALTTAEQQMFTDIHAIKEFLNQWSTQLSTYGLKTIQESLQPGHIAILFRNDHFSTLYKDPKTDQLVTLVTDQGYSSHDEIVWESLVDVNGQGSELFSGDFRPIGSNTLPHRWQNQPPVQSLLDVNDNTWATVRPQSESQLSSSPRLSSSQIVVPQLPESGTDWVEQEDHDLALALQLQEEEDDRHRRSVEERRRHENRLSEEAIAAQAETMASNRRTSRLGEQPPVIPPRRNNVQTHRPANEPAPPPTYQEAATKPVYHPPQGHPQNPQASVGLQGSAYQLNTQGASSGGIPPGGRDSRPPMNPLPGRLGGRYSAGASGPTRPEEREKCVVM